MNKPNFQTMTRKELRAYVLDHRDNDEAFYAYVDKIHETESAVVSAVFEWLKLHNPDKKIIQIPDNLFEFIITATDSNQIFVKLH